MNRAKKQLKISIQLSYGFWKYISRNVDSNIQDFANSENVDVGVTV